MLPQQTQNIPLMLVFGSRFVIILGTKYKR